MGGELSAVAVSTLMQVSAPGGRALPMSVTAAEDKLNGMNGNVAQRVVHQQVPPPWGKGTSETREQHSVGADHCLSLCHSRMQRAATWVSVLFAWSPSKVITGGGFPSVSTYSTASASRSGSRQIPTPQTAARYAAQTGHTAVKGRHRRLLRAGCPLRWSEGAYLRISREQSTLLRVTCPPIIAGVATGPLAHPVG